MSQDVNSNRKVFILGLDGATFDLIKPWVKSKELPNFARLIEKGCHGDLESIIPPLTTPAWSSFMTGKNPGKHGVFDFAERQPGSYNIEWVTSRSRKGQSLWNIVNSYGKDVVVINVPNNYPLDPVNGCMVAWMDAPGSKNDYTYPPELAREIEDNIGDYIITIIDWKENEDLSAFRTNLHRMIDKRAELTFYLMENKPWDLFTVLFTATDIVQHCYWSFMDPSHRLHNPSDAKEFGNTIKEIYCHIDEILGQIQSRLDEDTTLMIISDHGAGPLRFVVHLNKWLEENGWLTFRDQSHSTKTGRLYSALQSISRRALYNAMVLLKRYLSPTMRSHLKRLLPGMRDKMEGMLFYSLFDWQKTKAYSLGSYGNIYINLKGREPGGIVEEAEYEALRNAIADRIMGLKDPETGDHIVKRVCRREEIYSGPHLDKAADLIVHWNDNGYHSVQRFGSREDSVFDERLDFHLTNTRFTGNHRMEGIFHMNGSAAKAGEKVQEARLIDIAPTTLYLMGLPVPEDMDGRVLEEGFSPEYLQEHPVQYAGPAKTEEKIDSDFEGYDDADADKIAERLRNLGYID